MILDGTNAILLEDRLLPIGMGVGVSLPPVITQGAPAAFGPYVAGDTPGGSYTPGTYASSAGTIASIIPSWSLNGAPATGTELLADGDVVGLGEGVTDTVANFRSFSYGTVVTGAGSSTDEITWDGDPLTWDSDPLTFIAA